MPDEQISSRAHFDFNRARMRAFWRGIFTALAGQPNELLSYDEVREKLHIGGPIYRGMQTVRIDQIVGSLNRYHQFDRIFLPTQSDTAERWQRISSAFYEEISLPPVVLYKVGEVYFVVDGHHRVSVARDQGQVFIDADVRECQTKVNITPNITPEDLQILHEKVHFLERTSLDRLRPEADIRPTIPDGFDRMLEHIAVHRYFMGLDKQRDISEEEAITDWYDNVYKPIVNVIRQSQIMQGFPGKTESDLYLWVLDHQHYLAEERQTLVPPDKAAQEFVEGVE